MQSGDRRRRNKTTGDRNRSKPEVSDGNEKGRNEHAWARWRVKKVEKDKRQCGGSTAGKVDRHAFEAIKTGVWRFPPSMASRKLKQPPRTARFAFYFALAFPERQTLQNKRKQ